MDTVLAVSNILILLIKSEFVPNVIFPAKLESTQILWAFASKNGHSELFRLIQYKKPPLNKRNLS
jgi:hypothetical protein